MEYKDPGKYIPIIYLLYSWGSRFGVPSRVPLYYVLLVMMSLVYVPWMTHLPSKSRKRSQMARKHLSILPHCGNPKP